MRVADKNRASNFNSNDTSERLSSFNVMNSEKL